MLLWLSQTRTDRAVEELIDGSVSGSSGSYTNESDNSVVFKKARATFPDDFINEESLKLNLCNTPKIKRETESPTSSSSRNFINFQLGAFQSFARKKTTLSATVGSNLINYPTAESSPEVSSSQNGTGISPVPSLNSSEIGEVDLDFWDLDINESSSISHSSGK